MRTQKNELPMRISSTRKTTVGKAIAAARKARGWSQHDLATLLGISVPTLSAYETGRIIPAATYIEQIARHTQRPLHDFTGRSVAEAVARVDTLITELQDLKKILEQALEGGQR